MASARYDFEIEQGTDWELPLTWKDSAGAGIDTTGYKFYLQVEYNNSLIIDLTSPSGGITIVGNVITPSLSNSETTALSFDTVAYNLEYDDSSNKRKRMLQGYISLSKDITA